MGMASLERELPCLDLDDVYHTVDNNESYSMDLASRPPVPVPRPEASASGTHQLPNNEPYISKGKCGMEQCSVGSSELLSRNSLGLVASEPSFADCPLLNSLQTTLGDRVRAWGQFWSLTRSIDSIQFWASWKHSYTD